VSGIDIIIPSYGRSRLAYEVFRNADAMTEVEHRIIFVVEREELEDYEHKLRNANTPVTILVNQRTRSYAGAINTAVGTDFGGDYVFFGSDDLRFHPKWDIYALETMEALCHIKVVGTNDLWNNYVLRGLHSTHHLVDKDYIYSVGGVIDGAKGRALYEGYDHNYVDTEFIGTAKARAVFAPCLDSVVEHLHWTAGKSEKDSTSKKAYANISADSTLYDQRKALWWNLSR